MLICMKIVEDFHVEYKLLLWCVGHLIEFFYGVKVLNKNLFDDIKVGLWCRRENVYGNLQGKTIWILRCVIWKSLWMISKLWYE